MSEQYTFQSGEKKTIPTIIDKEDIDTYFKVNLPSTQEDFEAGSGEGVWACTSEESFQAWDKNGTGVHFVKVLNDSVYYPGLVYGTVIPVVFREENRPVALLEELVQHYGPSQKDEVIRFLLPRKPSE